MSGWAPNARSLRPIRKLRSRRLGRSVAGGVPSSAVSRGNRFMFRTRLLRHPRHRPHRAIRARLGCARHAGWGPAALWPDPSVSSRSTGSAAAAKGIERPKISGSVDDFRQSSSATALDAEAGRSEYGELTAMDRNSAPTMGRKRWRIRGSARAKQVSADAGSGGRLGLGQVPDAGDRRDDVVDGGGALIEGGATGVERGRARR